MEEKKNREMLSMVKAMAQSLAEKINKTTGLTTHILYNTILKYGTLCYIEGYNRKSHEIKSFKDKRDAAEDKEWKSNVEKLQDTINQNKEK